MLLSTPVRTPVFASMLLLASSLHGEGADQASANVEAALGALHAALRKGDVGAVERLLAPDAVILEGGHRESWAEYLSRFLQAGIEFARAVRSETLDVHEWHPHSFRLTKHERRSRLRKRLHLRSPKQQAKVRRR